MIQIVLLLIRVNKKLQTVQPRENMMTHLKRDVPISINNGVWGRIMLHTGISGSDLFSQGAVHVPTRLRTKPPLPIVPVATWGYLKSLQTNSWQMRWNSWFMKIWTWARLRREKSANAKLGWAGARAQEPQYSELRYTALPLLSHLRRVRAVTEVAVSEPTLRSFSRHHHPLCPHSTVTADQYWAMCQGSL